MAFSKVGETTFEIIADDANNDVTLPGTVLEGDIVIYGHCADSVVTPGVQTSGYTDIWTDHSQNAPGYESGYKVMGATPDTIITFVQDSQFSGENTAGVLQVWRGLDTATPEDATPTGIGGSPGMPDCPSITTVTDGALVFAIGFLDDDKVAASVTAPSGYSNLLAMEPTSLDNATMMIASKEVSPEGPEDPAAFGGSGTDEWEAATFALRPAVATGDTTAAWGFGRWNQGLAKTHRRQMFLMPGQPFLHAYMAGEVAVGGGRVMSSLAGPGGLVGLGGIAGQSGGLAA